MPELRLPCFGCSSVMPTLASLACCFGTARAFPASLRERFVLKVNAPGALRAAFTPPLELSSGRAFGAGLLDVEGDLEYAVDALYRASASLRPARLIRLIRLLRRLPKAVMPPLREARLHGNFTRAIATAPPSVFTTTNRSSSIAAFSIATWSIPARILPKASICSTTRNRQSSTTRCANYGSVRRTAARRRLRLGRLVLRAGKWARARSESR